MAKCFRCGKELSQPKCGQCGFDPQSGVRLLTRWSGKYDIPKVEPKAVAAPTETVTTRGAAAPQGPETAATQTSSTASSATQTQTRVDQVTVRRYEQKQRREDRKMYLLLAVLGVAALAVLAGLIFGGYHLVRWMGTFSGMTWKMIIGAVAAVAIAVAMIVSSSRNVYWIDQLNEFIGMPATVINLILMIIFPEAYGPVGALIAVGLGVGFAYLAYELLDYLEPGQGAACAVFMIANLLLFPHLWGASWLGYLLYAVIVMICGGLAIAYVNNDWDNPFVLQGAFVGIAVVFYLVGFLAMPHFMHALNGMPGFSEDRAVGQKRIEADCSCGETIEVNAFTEDLIHGTHGVFRFVFLPECEGDETGHWQICVCGETYNYQAHTYNDEGICGFCKYPEDGVEIGGETEGTLGNGSAETSSEELTTEENTTAESTTEEESDEGSSIGETPTQNGTGEAGPSDQQNVGKRGISIRTIVIIGAVVSAVFALAMVVIYRSATSRRAGATRMRQLSVNGEDLLLNLTVTGVYALIALTAVACAWVKAGTFGLSVMHLIIGLVIAVVVAAVMIGSAILTDEYEVQMTVSIILSVLNTAAMLIFPHGYRAIGAVAAGGLAVSLVFLTYVAFDDWEPGRGGANAVFMVVNLLMVFQLFGISVVGWIVLIAVVILWITVVVIYSCHAEMASGLQIGFGVIFLVASLCGYLFAPHFMHSLHQLPELGEQQSSAETDVAAECLCGETVGVSVTTVDWVHSFHILKAGGSAEVRLNEGEHWKVCVCGANYTYKEHTFDENDVCEKCGYGDDEKKQE